MKDLERKVMVEDDNLQGKELPQNCKNSKKEMKDKRKEIREWSNLKEYSQAMNLVLNLVR